MLNAKVFLWIISNRIWKRFEKKIFSIRRMKRKYLEAIFKSFTKYKLDYCIQNG